MWDGTTARVASAIVLLAVSVAGCAASGGRSTSATPVDASASMPAVTAAPDGTSATPAPTAAGPSATPSVGVGSVPPPAPIASPEVPPPAALAATPPPWFTLHVPILMYHRVAPPGQSVGSLPGLVVDPSVFAQQMDALAAAGWRTITVEDLYADLSAQRRPAPRTFVVTFDDGHADGYTYALPVLMSHGFVATYYVVTGRIGEPGELAADQVRALAAAGMEIADHTVRHVDLAALSPADQRAEITGAADSIAALTGTRPATFAYPFGDLDGTTVGIVEEAGFGLAVTNRGGVFESWGNRLLVPRIEVRPDVSGPGLVARLAPYALD